MPLALKALHTASTHNVVCLNVLEMFGIMTDTQPTHVVTFDFKGTGVRCVVCGTIDYQMYFFLVHNVSKCSRVLMIIVGMECGHTYRIDRHKRQADRTLLFEYITNTLLFFVGKM